MVAVVIMSVNVMKVVEVYGPVVRVIVVVIF